MRIDKGRNETNSTALAMRAASMVAEPQTPDDSSSVGGGRPTGDGGIAPTAVSTGAGGAAAQPVDKYVLTARVRALSVRLVCVRVCLCLACMPVCA